MIAVMVFFSMVADTYFTAIVCLVYDTQVFLNSSIGVIDSISLQDILQLYLMLIQIIKGKVMHPK